MAERQYGIRLHLPDGASADVPWTSEQLAYAQVRQVNQDVKPGGVHAEVIWRYVSDWQPAIPHYDDEQATAWHQVRLYRGLHPFDAVETLLCEITHPDECQALPPGAVCWVERDPHRDGWPTEPGRYRIRLVDQLTGGDEDGPQYMTALDVEPIPDNTTMSDTEVPAPRIPPAG
jgi:hypothetical protein